MSRPTIGLVLISAALVGCPSGGGGTGGLLDGVTGGDNGSGGEGDAELAQCADRDWGGGDAAAKLGGFMLATSKFLGATADINDEMVNTCKQMGGELGVSDADLGADVQGACNPVIGKLRTELDGLRAEANLNVKIAATPPVCEVKMDAYADCAASCEAEVDPGEVDLECEGGHIVGQCSGQCQGECSVDVAGACEGTCQGTCTAQCKGTCQGTCEGNCSAENAQGECNGKCEGTCHGTCEGGCQGGCEGECWVEGQASCSGECRGGCSVDYEAPRCTGEVRPPSVSAECKASCDARLNAEAECKPGKVEVVIAGDVQENMSERLDRVKAALRVGYAGIQKSGMQLRRLQASGQGLVSATGSLRGAFSGLGMQAVRATECVTLAGSKLPDAVASVGVSLDVQVSMSAAVTTGG